MLSSRKYINPKTRLKGSLLRAHKYYECVAPLALAFKESQTLSEEQVLAVVHKHHSDLRHHAADKDNLLSPEEIVYKLKDYILIHDRDSRGEVYSFNPQLLPAFLETQGELLIAGVVIMAHIDRIMDLKENLLKYAQQQDFDRVAQVCSEIQGALRAAVEATRLNTQAVKQIVEQVESQGMHKHFDERQQVYGDLWDNTVKPITDFNDPTIEGIYQENVRHIENKLEELLEADQERPLKSLGKVKRPRGYFLRLENTLFGIRASRRKILDSLQQTISRLEPFRTGSRNEHSNLSVAIHRTLNKVMRIGAAATFYRHVDHIPGNHIVNQHEAEDVDGHGTFNGVIKLLNYKPVPIRFPSFDQDSAAPKSFSKLFAELIIRKAFKDPLRDSLPVADLLRWGINTYPGLNDAEQLRLFQEVGNYVIRSNDLYINVSERLQLVGMKARIIAMQPREVDVISLN